MYNHPTKVGGMIFCSKNFPQGLVKKITLGYNKVVGDFLYSHC
jgi:hypothetical protein